MKSFSVGQGIQQRGIGDIIEDTVFVVTKGLIPELQYATSKRTMEDFQVEVEGHTYKFDVKTHDSDASFSMPNLVSVKRLKKYLADPTNHLVYVFITYEIRNDMCMITNVRLHEVDELHWDCLHIQNLGKGQLQLRNSNNIQLMEQNREVWLHTLTDKTVEFYNSLIVSLQKEIEGLINA